MTFEDETHSTLSPSTAIFDMASVHRNKLSSDHLNGWTWGAVALIVSIGFVRFLQYAPPPRITHDHAFFFEGNSEWFYMHSMPGWFKRVVSIIPYVDDDVREILQADSEHSHIASRQWYESQKHDRSHRKLIQRFLNETECRMIRSLMDRNSLQREAAFADMGSGSLWKEFERLPLPEVMLNPDSRWNVTHAEQTLLSQVLERLQKTVEETFHTDSIFLEAADLTRRQAPPNQSLVEYLHYLSTGGHKTHCDSCHLPNNRHSLFHDWECNYDYDHCCAHRTHSALLYLNDPQDTELRGGQVFLVDRQDLSDDSVPSFASDVGLKDAFANTLQAQPSCGNLLLFASDTRNLHGVFPMQRGTRYAMPMWYTSLPDLSWDPYDAEILELHMERWFWKHLRHSCTRMGKDVGFAVPSKFRQYVEDCDAMVEAARTVVGVNKRMQLRESRRQS